MSFHISAGVSVHLRWSQEAVSIGHPPTATSNATTRAPWLQHRTGASTASCLAKGLISHLFVFNLTPSLRFYLVWMCSVILLHLYSAYFKNHWKRPVSWDLLAISGGTDWSREALLNSYTFHSSARGRRAGFSNERTGTCQCCRSCFLIN